MTAAGGDLPDWNRRVSTADDIQVGTYGWTVPGTSPTLDVSQYASLVLEFDIPSLTGQSAQVRWFDAAGTMVTADYMTQFDGEGMQPLAIPVRAQYVQVVMSGAVGTKPSVTIYGSSRTLEQAIGSGFTSPSNASYPAQAWAANAIVELQNIVPQGLCQVELTIGTTAVVVEYLMHYRDVNGNDVEQRFADTTDAHVVGPNTIWRGQVIFPHVPCRVTMQPRTAGTFSVSCNIVALGR